MSDYVSQVLASFITFEGLEYFEFLFFPKNMIRPMASSLILSKSRFDPGSGSLKIKNVRFSRNLNMNVSFELIFDLYVKLQVL